MNRWLLCWKPSAFITLSESTILALGMSLRACTVTVSFLDPLTTLATNKFLTASNLWHLIGWRACDINKLVSSQSLPAIQSKTNLDIAEHNLAIISCCTARVGVYLLLLFESQTALSSTLVGWAWCIFQIAMCCWSPLTKHSFKVSLYRSFTQAVSHRSGFSVVLKQIVQFSKYSIITVPFECHSTYTNIR